MQLYLKTLLLSAITMQLACAQKMKATAINKVYAFSETHHVGNLPVDDNGKPLSAGFFTIYTIYVETSGTDIPQWATVTKSGMVYPVISSQELPKTALTVGTEKLSGKAVALKPALNNRFWKLELGQGEPAAKKNTWGDTLVLAGKYKGSTITYPVKTITELETLPRP